MDDMYFVTAENGRVVRIEWGKYVGYVDYKEEKKPEEDINIKNALIKASAIYRKVGVPKTFDAIDADCSQFHAEDGIQDVWVLGYYRDEPDKCGVYSVPVDKCEQGYRYKFEYAVSHFDAGCICFDGYWGDSYNRETQIKDESFAFITEDEPWVFTIEEGCLYGKRGKRGEKICLDDRGDLLYVSATRGFFPRDNKGFEEDQGLLVLYANETEVFCKSYVWTTESTRSWWTEVWLDENDEEFNPYDPEEYGLIKEIKIHTLNDFRVGWIVTGEKKTLWWITDRKYSRTTFRPHRVQLVYPYIRQPLHFGMVKEETDWQPTFEWIIASDLMSISLISNAELRGYNGYSIARNTTISHITDNNRLPEISYCELNLYSIVWHFTRPAVCDFRLALNTNIDLQCKLNTMYANNGGFTVVEGVYQDFYLTQKDEIFLEERGRLVVPRITNLKLVPIKPTDLYYYLFEENNSSKNTKIITPRIAPNTMKLRIVLPEIDYCYYDDEKNDKVQLEVPTIVENMNIRMVWVEHEDI